MQTPIDVKQVSPYDVGCAPEKSQLVQIVTEVAEEWYPSQFNARTTDDDGHIILWNSKTGAFTAFNSAQKNQLERYLTQMGYKGKLDKLGEYLRERGYIISKGTHEYKQFQALFGEQHYRNDTMELILLSSEDCNLRCKYCYENFLRGTMLPEVRNNIKQLVRNRAGSIRNLGISWFGGEPLYGMAAIEDLAPFFCEMVDQHHWVYSGTITTNAYLLTSEVAAKLLSWRIKNYQITVDGTQEQHDLNRPARDGSGTFQVIFNNLRELAKLPDEFAVRLRVNFDNETYPHLTSFLDMLQQSFGADPRFKLAFHPVGKWGGANDANLDVCGTRESFGKLQRLHEQATERGLGHSTFMDGNVFGGGVCYAARPYNFIIGADGKVMKCTVALDQYDYNVVGTLRDGGQLVLDPEKWAKWVEPAFAGDKGCQKCYLLPNCQGLSCPWIRFEENVSPCAATVKPNLHHHLVTAFETKRNSPRLIAVNNSKP